MVKISEIIKLVFLGAVIGSFVLNLVELLLIAETGVNNFIINGETLYKSIIGSIIIGQCFSLPTLIYKKEDIPTLIQIIVQMGIGFIGLVSIGIYLDWIPLELGPAAIISWIIIALIFGFVIWAGFYIYYYIEAREINKKIKKRVG